MSTEPETPETDDGRLAREALSALGSAPAPGADFRLRLRSDFAAGAIAPGAKDAGAAAHEPPEPKILVLSSSRGVWSSRWRWVAGAAAAALAVVALVATNAPPRWRVVSAYGEGDATINGNAVPMNDPAKLADALVSGATIQVPAGATLQIAIPGVMAIAMNEGSDAIVPRAPGRWFGRDVSTEIRSGEWHITTGAAFRGARFSIDTPSAHVELTGTTLAVICEPNGTCVCVFEGQVHVGRDAAHMVTVSSGQRRYTYADATHEPYDDAMLPRERPALGEFRESMRRIVKRAR
jgi:ferric-dicitrate binding protein FerR (iron transport regulator)